jgi:hypothetical protein
MIEYKEAINEVLKRARKYSPVRVTLLMLSTWF